MKMYSTERVPFHLEISRPTLMVGRMNLVLGRTEEHCADNIMPDYQFDVYRMMRAHNQNDWEGFNPLTNVIVCSIQ